MTHAPFRRQAPLQLPPKKVLFIVSNPGTLKGFPVGFVGEELTRPFFDFVSVGYEVDVVTPRGGRAELDGG